MKAGDSMDQDTPEALSQDQLAAALDLLAEMAESGDHKSVLARQSDPQLRAVLENLWSQHLEAEKQQFLEKALTVVGELSTGGRDVFQAAQILAGRFAILRRLGRGGMGEVYLAYDEKLTENVALKTVKRVLTRDPQNRQRFLEEVQNSRRVTHPNVCRIFDLFEHEGVPFFSMEYAAGPTLAEVLATGPLNTDRARTIAIQTAEGLQAAHGNGILHCDFKPGNIILSGSGKGERAVITDFGLARALGRRSADTEGDSSIAGTPTFMAPELLRGESPTIQSDIYALGKVLDVLLPNSKLGARCAAPEAGDRPRSVGEVLRDLRGGMTRRRWIEAAGSGTVILGTGIYFWERSRRIVLGSRQRVQVNGFRATSPASKETAAALRGLLVLALRQFPLLSVLGDRQFQEPTSSNLLEAGVPLPLGLLLSTAAEQKARLAIEGSVEPNAGRLRLKLDVYETDRKVPVYSKELEVDDPRKLVQLAELAADDLRRNAFEEAEDRSSYTPLESVTSHSPAAVDCYFRAISYYEKREITPALALLDQAIELDPGFALAHHYKALALTAAGLMESALQSAQIAYANRQQITAREKNWIEGQYFNITQDWDQSVAALEKNTIRFPDEAIFHRQRAFSLMRLGSRESYDKAIQHSRRAAELDPIGPSYADELLINLAEANQADECLATAPRLEVATGKTYPNARWLAHMQRGQYDEAAGDAQRLAEDRGEHSLSRLRSISPLVMQGRFESAIQMISADLARESTVPVERREQIRLQHGLNALGHLYRLKGEPEKAAGQAALLVELRPLACNLIRLREGVALAAELGRIDLAEQGLGKLRRVAGSAPHSHAASAVWLAEAQIRDSSGAGGAGALFRDAAATWPDPINLYYAARWQVKNEPTPSTLQLLLDMDRQKGKVFKHHFAGMVVFGWMEQAKYLSGMSEKTPALRMYDQVANHWSRPEASSCPAVKQALEERAELKKGIRR